MTTVDHPKTIGKRIATAITAAGKKPVWLAAELNVHPDTVDRWIKGTTQPSFAQVMRVAAALDQSLDYFAEDGAA